MMKILFLLLSLLLTSCTYNIDSSVAGNYTNTVTGNTVRNATPQVIYGAAPAVIVNPIPVTGWAWGGGGFNYGCGTPWGYGPVYGGWNNYGYGCW